MGKDKNMTIPAISKDAKEFKELLHKIGGIENLPDYLAGYIYLNAPEIKLRVIETQDVIEDMSLYGK